MRAAVSSSEPRTRRSVMDIVDGLVVLLAPACHRLEVAGSYARETPIVHDLEFVCIPKSAEITGSLYGGQESILPSDYNLVWCKFEGLRLEDRLEPQNLDTWAAKRTPGSRLLRVVLTGPQLAVEVYMVTPERWGCIMAIRTGPRAFSQGMVTHAKKRRMAFKKGRLWSDSVIDTPEESDVFAALGVPYLEPKDRKEWIW